jgi:T-complex protein 1 subunit theta
MTAENIYDHQMEKANALRLAASTVLTILRVDQIIHSKPAGGPRMPGKQGHWDDD